MKLSIKKTAVIALSSVALLGTGFAGSTTANAVTEHPAPYPIADVWNYGYSGPSNIAGYPHYYSQYMAYPPGIGSKAWVGSWAGNGGWQSTNWGYAESDVLSFGTGSYNWGYYYY